MECFGGNFMDNEFLENGISKYEDIKIPENLGKDLKRTFKKRNEKKKLSQINKVMGGMVAALIAFVVIVNVSPDIAYALDSIPVINKLAQFVSFDKGLKNVVSNGQIQNFNATAESNGAKITINSIAGDNLKLWIGYDFKGENLRIVRIKFKSKDGDKELPWNSHPFKETDNYIEVSMDKLVKNFNIEFEIYKDDPIFNVPIASLDEDALKAAKEKVEKSKVTTLTVPITLDEKIFKENLNTIDINQKEIKTSIGTFRVEKLELDQSRSRVYCNLISEDYEMIRLIEPKLIDENGNQYGYPVNYQNGAADNKVIMYLVGGIKTINGLNFKCSGIEYINKKDKYITVDLKKKIVEPNNLGINLVNVEGNKIILSTSKKGVQFGFNIKNENGDEITLKEFNTSSTNENQELEFRELKGEKIILNVEKIDGLVTEGFNLNLGE